MLNKCYGEDDLESFSGVLNIVTMQDGKICQHYLYVKQLSFVIQKMISIPADASVKALARIGDVLVDKRVLSVQPSATMALLAKIYLMTTSS